MKKNQQNTNEKIERKDVEELLKDYREKTLDDSSQLRGSTVRSTRPELGDFVSTSKDGSDTYINVTATKGRSPLDKRKKFIKLSVPRVDNAARAIRSIGKLSNTYAYKFEAKEVSKIISHLQKELDDVEALFKRALARESKSKGFSLD